MNKWFILATCVLILTVPMLDAEEPVEEEALEGIEHIGKVLKYGIDSSVKEAIASLKDLNTTRYSQEILDRLRASKNDEVIIEGLQYFRHFKLNDALDFAIETMGNHADNPVKVSQYCIYYIDDFHEELTEENRTVLIRHINSIIEAENIGAVLPALKLIPQLYTEKDVPYTEPTELPEFEREEISSSILLEDEVSSKTQGRQRLYSATLKEYYDLTNVQIIKGDILTTLGKIQAFAMLDDILAIAENDVELLSLRIEAIKALGFYEEYPSETIRNRIVALFENLRFDEQAQMRAAVFEAIKNTKRHGIYDDVAIDGWLLSGLRDVDEKVRIEALGAVNAQLEHRPDLFSSLDFFPYMIENDPSTKVRETALANYVALQDSTEGKAYLNEKLLHIRSVTAESITLLKLAAKKMDELATVDSLLVIAERFVEHKMSYLLRILAETVAKYKNKSATRLAELLIASPDSEVIYHALTLIAKNRIVTLYNYVAGITKDRTKSLKTRQQGKRVLGLLEEELQGKQ